MFAAECTTPWRTTAGTVTPIGESDDGNRPTSSAKTSATAAGVAGLGVLIFSRVAGEVAGAEVDGGGLDAAAAEVDADGVFGGHGHTLPDFARCVAARDVRA